MLAALNHAADVGEDSASLSKGVVSRGRRKLSNSYIQSASSCPVFDLERRVCGQLLYNSSLSVSSVISSDVVWRCSML